MAMKITLGALLSLTLLIAAYPANSQQDAKQTLQEIYKNELQDYQSWSVMPGSTARMEGKGAHGKFITTFVNETGLAAINNGADQLPDGSILIKDNFNTPEDESPWSAVMMKKVEGEWFYGVFYPPYESKMAGFATSGSTAEKACLSCHQKAPNDRVFLWKK